jgi:hypothetical protein
MTAVRGRLRFGGQRVIGIRVGVIRTIGTASGRARMLVTALRARWQLLAVPYRSLQPELLVELLRIIT